MEKGGLALPWTIRTPHSWERSLPIASLPYVWESVYSCIKQGLLGWCGDLTDRKGPAPHHAQQRLLCQCEQHWGAPPAQSPSSTGLAIPGDWLLPGHRHGEQSGRQLVCQGLLQASCGACSPLKCCKDGRQGLRESPRRPWELILSLGALSTSLKKCAFRRHPQEPFLNIHSRVGHLF